jgi:branched-chain amino acid transport system ATP-binding protein
MSALLEVRNVSLAFGGVRALRDVSLDINEGEILSIIGPNGAGKTTLFNVISGVYRPSAGSVRFAGRELIGMPLHRIAALGIARTYQVVRPFPRLSVVDNVAVAALLKHRSLTAARRAARDVVASVGLARLADNDAGTLTLTQRKRLEVEGKVAV